MRRTTKTFIEENIDLIEDKDWITFYQHWYDDAYGEIENDESRVDDLNDALYEAGVGSLKETFEARKQIIRKEVESIIQYWIDNIDEWTGSYNWVGMQYITHTKLCSHLGLDYDVVKDIVKEVAISKDLVPDKHSEGFRLRRA